jgi:hypothetical protein
VVTPDEQLETASDRYGLEPRVKGITPFRVLFPIGAILFISFWTWALFFASKTAVNKVDDETWGPRAEAICAPVKQQLRELELQASSDLDVRADLVMESTGLLEQMIDEVTAVMPSDEKGQSIVPDWEADYRTLIADRYAYAEQLRAGDDGPFTETAVNNIPITERIETFAGDNDMPSCSPPRKGVLN